MKKANSLGILALFSILMVVGNRALDSSKDDCQLEVAVYPQVESGGRVSLGLPGGHIYVLTKDGRELVARTDEVGYAYLSASTVEKEDFLGLVVCHENYYCGLLWPDEVRLAIRGPKHVFIYLAGRVLH